MKQYVTPQEAIELSGHLHISVLYAMADLYLKIDDALRECKKTDLALFYLRAFATIWNAGRIHGIRSERAKRKK